MTWVSDPDLTAAVSDAGGLGVLACGNMSSGQLREQIKRTREKSDRQFGVNLVLIADEVENCIKVASEERVHVLIFGAGNCSQYISSLKKAGIIVIPVVASVALARRLERAGADAVIAEGEEAGGHIGTTSTMALVPQMVDALHIPVIAAGGIGDGRGLVAAFALGAEGIQLGTRLVVAHECKAHENYKEAIIRANDRSTAVTGRSIHAPVRALKNNLTLKLQQLESYGASREEIERLAVGKLQSAVIDGNVVSGSVMMGQIAGLIKKRQSVEEIFKEMIAETKNIFNRLGMLSAN